MDSPTQPTDTAAEAQPLYLSNRDPDDEADGVEPDDGATQIAA